MRVQKINKWKGQAFLLPVVFTLLFILLSSGVLFGQLKYDYEWMLGYNSLEPGDENPEAFRFAVSKLSFLNNPPDTIRTDIVGSTGFSNTLSMANSSGELIFFTNGCSLFDPDGNQIPGGEELLFGSIYMDNCVNPPTEGSKDYGTPYGSTLSLPMDNRDSLFFLIYHRIELNSNAEGFTNPTGLVSFELYKKRIVKNEERYYEGEHRSLILRQNLGQGFFTAVRDTMAHHWWVIIPPDYHLDNYELIRIGPSGVDTILTYVEDHERIHPDFEEFPYRIQSGQSVISPDGGTYVRWIAEGELGAKIYDFDRTNGKLSNLRYISHPEKDNFVNQLSSFGGASISSNGRFLYLNTAIHLWQYDLYATDIEGSKVHIAEFDNFVDPGNNFPVYFYLQKLAPNCKIYMSSPNTVRYLHVINHPNRKGLDCDFQQSSFILPGNQGTGLPYHPNYRLDSDYPVCDTLLSSTTWFVPEGEDPGIHLYPNPAREYAVVAWSGMDPVELRLFDMAGRQVLSESLYPGQPEYYMQLPDIPVGVYIVLLRDRSGAVATERLMVME